ncbi:MULTISPECIES: IS21-like element helper ATPase IstB [unclassified Enterococcus]|uniref:IS21-like element helper ATPase IstB n=1 Tax=unclassified Enterococcus TaxID=2608891 RepID=UPI0013EC3015|nr:MULTISPECIES: IS21-like element helper ATPase IstB [unclassified Enterococcus]
MSNYYHLLNKLEDLNLKHTRETLPEYLDTIVQENLSFVEALNHLMTEEIHSRNERQKENRLRKANLPFKKTMNDFDFGFQPKINRTEILALCTLRFMDTNNNILFIGNSGVGKTHLAIPITLAAISNELVNRLNRANQRGNLDRLLKKYASYDLLIIDEIGYLPFTPDGAKLFFQLINLRYEKKSTIITTNIPLSQWAETFQDKKLTNALIDRLVHHAKIIRLYNF